jgi:uncharacterized protein (TIGR02453 family)
VREPALAFIAAMDERLTQFAPQFEGIAKKAGGSLMRVHRDVRFGVNKSPYKTNVGIQFRHRLGKDVHAPGYYVHIEPGEHFLGVGLWRPEPAALAAIRNAIVERSKAWRAARDAAAFRKTFELSGESLTRAPRGFDSEHPLIDDIKRKDFIATASFDDAELLRRDFVSRTAARFAAATPLMQFLCRAIGVNF